MRLSAQGQGGLARTPCSLPAAAGQGWKRAWTWSQESRILFSALSWISSVTLDKSLSPSELSSSICKMGFL